MAGIVAVVVFIVVMLKVLASAEKQQKRVISEAFLEICKAMREAEEKEKE